MRRARIHPVLLAGLLTFSLVSPLCADQVVYFINGKAIMVKSVEKGDKFTVLEMEGGGKMGVPTDQIERIEEYVLSAPAAPSMAAPVAPPMAAPMQAAPAPGLVQAPAAAQSAGANPGPVVGIPANMAPAPPMVPGPGVGGRPTDTSSRGMAGLRPIDVSGGGAAPLPGLQRQVPQSNAGPAMGGPAAFRGNTAARPNFNPAGRRVNNERSGVMGRRGRQPEMNRYQPLASPPPGQNQPPAPGQPPAQGQPAQGQPPAQEQPPAQSETPDPNPPPATEEDPPAPTDPETEAAPPADPENETPESEAPPAAEGETPDDSSGGAS